MDLPIKKQCEILCVSRSSYYYKPVLAIDQDEIMAFKAILEELKRHPFYGYRKIAVALKSLGVTRKQVRLIMKKAGLRAIYPGKRLSIPSKYHDKYPYLLREKDIWFPNCVFRPNPATDSGNSCRLFRKIPATFLKKSLTFPQRSANFPMKKHRRKKWQRGKGLSPFDKDSRLMLLEIIEDRIGISSTIVST